MVHETRKSQWEQYQNKTKQKKRYISSMKAIHLVYKKNTLTVQMMNKAVKRL